MASPTHWTLMLVRDADVATARALTQQFSDSGDAGMTFLEDYNSTGTPDDPVTHWASGSAVGPEVLGMLPVLKATLVGSDYYPPAPLAERDCAAARLWLAAKGLKLIQRGSLS